MSARLLPTQMSKVNIKSWKDGFVPKQVIRRSNTLGEDKVETLRMVARNLTKMELI